MQHKYRVEVFIDDRQILYTDEQIVEGGSVSAVSGRALRFAMKVRKQRGLKNRSVKWTTRVTKLSR